MKDLLHPGCVHKKGLKSRSLTVAEKRASISAAVVGSVFVVFICIAESGNTNINLVNNAMD